MQWLLLSFSIYILIGVLIFYLLMECIRLSNESIFNFLNKRIEPHVIIIFSIFWLPMIIFAIIDAIIKSKN